LYQINFKIDYIHAEKLSEMIKGQIQVQIQITAPSSQPTWKNGLVIIPYSFNLSTTPPAFIISIKGKIIVKGQEDEINNLKKAFKKKEIPPQILQVLTQNLIFEATLISRELGFPPSLPLPISKKEKSPPTMQPI